MELNEFRDEWLELPEAELMALLVDFDGVDDAVEM